MAEALGIASSVIAIVDITGKAVSLSFKLESLWYDIKDVPAVLLEKVEELQNLKEILHDAETQASAMLMPNPALSNAIVQKHLGKARAAFDGFQNTIETHHAQAMD
ncbi:hypothetical protein CCHL11_07881 [Colletotrichum chlorophyti]|uniref:Fungal N-terminal domain-containing protein n=1 Tax=Colletotrichum chlorophyti TaxID=708187 RepID=A0A1Q8RR22_9PEZI|nr:hypothetical protein CCHL11_07881 [Colletotrichum chlorophyti]